MIPRGGVPKAARLLRAGGEAFQNAKRNIERFGEWGNVDFTTRSFTGYPGGDFDARIHRRERALDGPGKMRDAVKGSAPIGMIVPTANQISDALKALEEGFATRRSSRSSSGNTNRRRTRPPHRPHDSAHGVSDFHEKIRYHRRIKT
jgi:hypothetical protein